MMRQLALPLPMVASFDARDVIADASNEAARSWLAKPEAWPLGRLALFGEAGLGTTHLARAAAARFGWRWLNGMGLRGLPPPAPEGSVVDDADCVADEAALLHLINLCAERGETLLLIGRAAPARWPIRLPDLTSRLRATQAVGIGAPSDALLRALLTKFFADRQLRVEPEVQAWLRRRITTHPMKQWEDELVLQGRGYDGLPKTFIHCTGQKFSQTSERMIGPALDNPDWNFIRFPYPRTPMATHPRETAELLASL
jgi:hypothetical protein